MFFDAASVVAAHGWKIPASFGGRRARCIYGPIACFRGYSLPSIVFVTGMPHRGKQSVRHGDPMPPEKIHPKTCRGAGTNGRRHGFSRQCFGRHDDHRRDGHRRRDAGVADDFGGHVDLLVPIADGPYVDVDAACEPGDSGSESALRAGQQLPHARSGYARSSLEHDQRACRGLRPVYSGVCLCQRRRVHRAADRHGGDGQRSRDDGLEPVFLIDPHGLCLVEYPVRGSAFGYPDGRHGVDLHPVHDRYAVADPFARTA